MCLSGDVTALTDEQWKTIDDGIAFYKEIAPIIKDGFTYFYPGKGPSDKYLTGYQGMVRVKTKAGDLRPEKGAVADEAYACIHFFNECDGKVTIKLPDDCPRNIKTIYKGTDINVRIEGDMLIADHKEDMEAIAIHLVK